MAKLNHPNIVHVYDVDEAKGKKFIAMEYIQGGTLSDIIRRGVEVGDFLPIEHALHIAGQAAVVRIHATEVQECFDRALMEQPDLRGRLSLRATIDADGRVLDVSQVAAGMAGGGRLQECVVRAFRGWIFPPPTGGGEGYIAYSFRFE